MLFSRRSRDELHEARVADLKESHENRVRELMRLVDALAEQVEYLRAQLGRPFIAAGHPGLNPASQPQVVLDSSGASTTPLHVSEEEEDLLALHEMGHVDDWELEALRGQLGLNNVSRDS
jgi:hypothetical protein